MASAGPSNRLGNNGGRAYNFLFQPVNIDCSFVVDNTTATGISGLKGAGVNAVYMYSSSPSSANPLSDSTASAGIALIQLSNNYYKYGGMYGSFIPPLTGSNVAINGSALTVGKPYVITSVGAGTKGAVTIAPVADSSGSLASTYFSLYDSYGNKYVVWFSVSGVGAAPSVSGTLVQQSIVTNDTAATIGAALVVTLGGLFAAQAGNVTAPSGVYSFTAAGTTTVTVTNTANSPFPGGPQEGAIATGFTFAVTKDQTNDQNWRAVGLPKGVNAAVGASFVATATGYSTRGGSTGLVKAVSVSGISSIEPLGDVNQSINPGPLGGSPNIGGWVMVQFLAPTFTGESYTPAGTVAAPTFTGNAIQPAFTVKTGTIGANMSIGLTADAVTASLVGGTGITADRSLTTNNPVGTVTATGTNSAPAFTGTAHTLAGTMTLAKAAPAAGTTIRLNFVFESKSIIIAGE